MINTTTVSDGELSNAVSYLVNKYDLRQFQAAWNEEDQQWHISYPFIELPPIYDEPA